MVLFVIFQVGGSMFELEQVGLAFGTPRYTAFRAARYSDGSVKVIDDS
jgi:hypothetical protein